ncbi:hypothetical protein AZA_87696 [Nitrospirillum viridazoti Y2]|uniref:hypothetical protein n=1 Tax=Nitrospirillum viridazoti TaxID=3144925 RepID=UPI0002265116|nr:hypothetical protein [Nitrospirillum amazonense]EGY02686.1 hypothetical protein AZA_87696 [Nitrospirillum amazonense Y2]
MSKNFFKLSTFLAAALSFYSTDSTAGGWAIQGAHITRIVTEGDAIYLEMDAPFANVDGCAVTYRLGLPDNSLDYQSKAAAAMTAFSTGRAVSLWVERLLW